MARKNLLAGLTDTQGDASPAASSYPMRGASKTMIRSLDELAKQADKFLEGEAVVEVDPKDIEQSFVADRMEDDGEAYKELKQAIAERGQDSPVLLRPHPNREGHYQVVFGHRRVRVAAELGRPVRAVVKALDDRTHVIAQGQENSARANLSFIERAIFAKRLVDLGYSREVVSSALAANAAAVSKMMSVTERIDEETVKAIGPARTIGRERWVELSLLAGRGSNAARVRETVSDPDFARLESDDRFNMLLAVLNQSGKPVKKTRIATKPSTWQPADKQVAAEYVNSGTAFTLTMKAKNAGGFGNYLSENLDRLYGEFLDKAKG